MKLSYNVLLKICQFKKLSLTLQVYKFRKTLPCFLDPFDLTVILTGLGVDSELGLLKNKISLDLQAFEILLN